jgi:cell wall-associated NlpC family hydrolase
LSDSASARHRTTQRAVSPLTQLTDAVTDGLSDAGRTGAIVAISTGLLAAVSLPAQAVTRTSSSPSVAAAAAGPAVAAAPAYSAQPSANVLAHKELGRSGSAFTAPSTTAVSFESGSFTAVPRQTVVPAPAAEEPSAQADVRRSSTSRSTTTAERPATGGTTARGSSVLSIAARYVGTPYVYGGTTPKGFDCSGYTRYVYKQLGVSLPRTADQQLNATRRISRSAARPGDLVFFVSGGRAYHNGIYAGNGMMYDAPRSGKSVQKREIWDATIVFGRVGG